MDSEKTSVDPKKFWISVDPGVNFCGIVKVDPSDRFTVKESVLVKNNRAFSAEEKLVEIQYGHRTVKIQAIIKCLESMLGEGDVDTIVIEAPFYSAMSPASYASLLEVLFAIKHLVIIRKNLNMRLIEPTVVKKIFTGNGMASKDLMRQTLVKKKANGDVLIPCEIDQLSEHEVDGVAIGYTYYLALKKEKTGA